MRTLSGQNGATLVVSLVMLVIITLFVLSSVNLIVTDLRVVGNMQNKSKMLADAQQAVEDAISSLLNFTAPAAQNVVVNGTPVTVTGATCINSATASGYSAVSNITLYDSYWVVDATATDPVTGATASVSQGVRIRLPSNPCL